LPVIFSNPAFPNQQSASQNSQAYNVQTNAGQMIREVCEWNPQVDPQTALRFINNYYRKFADMRSWYGLKLRGQIVVPNTVNQGIATFTNGSQVVTGVGTNWTSALVGQQIRSGFTYPLQTIISVQSATQLTMDMPFGGLTIIEGGYNIFSAYITMGGNIKRMLWAVNQQQGWPMKVNVPVEALNQWDVWRISIGWSTHMATRPPTPDGQYQIEVWPTPYQNQVFPFEAYQEPNDMVLDSDAPLAFVRSDLLVTRAVADALLFKPKSNPFYDPVTAVTIAQMKIKEWDEAVEQAQQADNDTDQRDVSWDYGEESDGWGGEGSIWSQMHS
jgi:hypothetical protein